MKEEVLIIKNKKVIGKFMAKIIKTDKNTGKLKDGRHISDNFTNETGYIEAKNFIKSIDRDIEFIKKENMKEYLEDTEFIESCPKFINTFKR